ncbi:hypothetical protein [Corallococcus sp. AS-1-12]|uniref:hypothetical protein n=1 Tax=Corallococcus sp. AS-1-12 TaxID=2874598 RepID=UPI001CBC8388|nr:hypothetical protein [Corallococcus sp. AS-1-12]MBZ4336424.1 hypothetical protein [Corallococcus sp. AS-1-12]
MSGGLRVGDLYVAVTATVGPALANLGKLVEGVEKAAKQVKAAAKDMGEIGMVVAAGIAGAVAAAATSNAAMAKETERIKALLYTLAADIGDAFLPVVKQVADGVERVVAHFQSLAPDVKASAANMLVWAASAGVAGMALSKAAGIVASFSGGVGLVLKVLGALDKSVALTSLAASVDKVTASLGGLTAKAPATMGSLGRLALSFGGLLVPLSAVAAAVAALVLLAGSVYAAWEDSSTGVADLFRGMGEQLSKWAGKVADGFTRAFVALGDFVKRASLAVLDVVAAHVRAVSRLLEPVVRHAGFPELAATFREVSTVTGRELLDTLGQSAQVLWDGAKQTAEAVGESVADAGAALKESVAYGLRTSTAGAKKLGTDMARALNLEGLTGQIQALLTKLAGGSGDASGKARIRKPTDKAALEAARKKEAAEQAAMAKLQAQANEESRKEYLASVRADESAGAAAFHEMRLEAERLAAEAEAAMEAARESLVDRFIGGLGQLGDLINAGVQGMEAGGAYGAIIAVVGELLMQSEGFKGVIESVNTLIQKVADSLGTLLEPLQPLLNAVTMVVDGFLSALTPVFEMLGEAIEPLVPPLVVLGDIVKGLAPLFAVLGRTFLLIQQPLSILGGPVMKALFTALKFVGSIVLTIAKAISEVWNAVIGAVQNVIRAISSLIDWTGFDGLKKFARSLNRLKVDTDSMDDSLRVLEDTTWDSAKARAEETAQVEEHTKAVARATAALTNVPAAWRVALRRFESEDTQDGPTVLPKPKPSPTPNGEAEVPDGPASSSGQVPGWLLGMLPPAIQQILLGQVPATPAVPGWLGSYLPPGFSGGGQVRAPETGNVSAMAAPVTYNITGYDIDAAMEATRRDESLRQQRASIRVAGSRVRLTSRFSVS